MENKTFHIGLCLAGAVSAGAYSAGVMDYLFEALAKWQKRKNNNVPDTPSHDVIISIIGGASAGGMTGIITAAALNNKIVPVKFPETTEEIFAEQPLNKFYHSWVDLLDKDMFTIMLDPSDINKDNKVFSLFNSDFIDQLAESVIQVNNDLFQPLPRFIHPQLKIFTTLTNLNGFPYDITYKANISDNKYFMAMHNDYACFQLNKNDVVKDGWMLLDFVSGKNTTTAKEAAMATGAFPVGLKSRTVTRNIDDLTSNPWLPYITKEKFKDDTVYTSQNIDGGTFNNEPFEKVRSVLTEITMQVDPSDYNSYDRFKSSILLIDPFPSEKSAKFKIDLGLTKTIAYTVGAIVGQGRAKPIDFSNALDEDCAGQFLIAPARRRPTLEGKEEQVQGEKAIASGAFDGFSGFVNKEFRVHDFFLGRHNCEIVLRKYFTIPESSLLENEIFRDGYANVDKSKFIIPKEQDYDKTYYPIIPIFDDPTEKFPIPVFSSGSQWPVIDDNAIEKYRPLVKERVQAILMNISGLTGIKKFELWLGTKLLLNKLVSNAVMNTLKKALQSHQLLKSEHSDDTTNEF